MKNVINFIEHEDVIQSELFSQLKCSEAEVKILQQLVKKFLQGNEDMLVLEVLQDLYGAEDYTYLEHLTDIKVLLELGWINQRTFTPIKISEVINLELLNGVVGLTSSFLRLLEEGSLELSLPDVKPYADHLEYLQDQFFRIEMYQKMSAIRHNVHEHSLGIDRIQNKLNLLETRIAERISQTAEDIVLDKFFKQKKLEKKEEVIF